MAKGKQSRQAKPKHGPLSETAASPVEEQVVFGSSLALHDLFQQQAMRMLDNADLSDEQKQEILIAMACPCCGAGAMSYTVKLKK